MAEVKIKAKMSQAEIDIIEEKLSNTHGVLPVEIAAHLSNRFDKVLQKIESARSRMIYTDRIKGVEERKKKIIEIHKSIEDAKKERQASIAKWYKKVVAYITAHYGEPIKDPNGTIISYGERLEVKANKHLKKYW